MSTSPSSIDPKIIPIVVLAFGLIIAIFAGTWVAEGSWFSLGSVLIICLGTMLVLGLRDKWWAVIPWMSALSFSTYAPGFQITGVDIAAMLSVGIIILRYATHNAPPVTPSLRINWGFYCLLVYVFLHSIIIIIINRYEGETQLKNIVKAYYQAGVPLFVLFLLFTQAASKSIRPVVIGLLCIYPITFCISIVVIFLQVDIPILSYPNSYFEWASKDGVGYIRWSSLIFLPLALCMSACNRSNLFRVVYYGFALIALLGALVGGGRVALACCLFIICLWVLLQKNFFLIGIGGAALVISLVTINVDPTLLNALPKTIQRALTPFVISQFQTNEQQATALSDQWHTELRSESWAYWRETTPSTLAGHGFQGWNDAIDIKTFTGGVFYEEAKKMAIQMGRTERTFNSILVIFGAFGILLYYGLILFLLMRTTRLRALTQKHSFQRCMCEFSMISLLVVLVTSFHAGSIPGYNMVFWLFGILSCRDQIEKLWPQAKKNRVASEPTTFGQLQTSPKSNAHH